MGIVTRTIVFSLVTVLCCCKVASSEIITFGAGDNRFEMEFVTIGNSGNAADGMGDPVLSLGGVRYTYHMAKYEVSQDMVDKVNASTTLDGAPLELYTLTSWAEQPTLDFYGISDAQQPAVGVTWTMAARFVNWLNESSGYPPAYNFPTPAEEVSSLFFTTYLREDATMWAPEDRGYDRAQPYRNRFARFVIPSLDEWYKAAYHDAESGTEAVYFNYATGSDEAPIAVSGGTEPGTAVYLQPESQGPAIVTQAGGPSPYGTIGQGGNAYEHLESFPRDDFGVSWSAGGAWSDKPLVISSRRRRGTRASAADPDYGIRVAMLNPFGDFDEDGVITGVDIDLLSEAIEAGSAASIFDLNQDDVVDLVDHRFWVEDIAETHFGDADLNGTVEFADFLQLSANFNQETGWAGGDFDGNGVAEFADFLLLSDNFGKTRSGTASVPEPSAGLLASLVGVVFGKQRQPRRQPRHRPDGRGLRNLGEIQSGRLPPYFAYLLRSPESSPARSVSFFKSLSSNPQVCVFLQIFFFKSRRVDEQKLAPIRDMWPGKLLLKGMASEPDAELATKLGVDGIVVSNHGGRQLDAGESSIHSLTRLAAAYRDKLTVMMDSGIRSGTDIGRCIASGAKFTFLGRPFMYGVAALGDTGADHTMSILKAQLHQLMEQLCCERIADFPQHLITE